MKIKILLLIVLLAALSAFSKAAQTYEIRAVNKGNGYVGVEMRITSDIPLTAANSLTDLVFGLKWQNSYNVDLENTIITDYNIVKSDFRKLKNGFHYQAFSAANTPFPFSHAWQLNEWVEVITIRNTLTSTGFGTFEIAEAGFDVTTDANFGNDLVDYTPVITGSAGNVPLSSTNANLSNLSLSQGILTPAFAPGTTSYAAIVPFNTTSVSVIPTVADVTATVKVNNNTVASGTSSSPIPLSVGANTINTVVTAQDGTSKTYSVIITREAARLSDNASLSNLILSTGTLKPSFASGTTAYTASVANSKASLKVTPTVADATASIKVNGSIVSNGSQSQAIPLKVGTNTIKIVVTAQDGITTKTYKVVVTRAASSDAYLSDLSLSEGTLTPGFAQKTTTYTASVPYNTRSVTVTPTAADADASIKVNGFEIYRGRSSRLIQLSRVGSTFITIEVTAEDRSTTKTYFITISILPRTSTRNTRLSSEPEATVNMEVRKQPEVALQTKSITVYPNPTNGEFTLQIPDLKVPHLGIQILNENGKVVDQRSVNTIDKSFPLIFKFNLRNQAHGMYFIKVISAMGVQTIKLIVLH